MDSNPAASIGPMRGHEREAVRQLYREYRAFIESLYPFRPFDDAEIEALPGQVYVFRSLTLIADAQVMGCAALRPLAPGIAELKRLYVQPQARGQQAGRRLTEYVIGEARVQGYQSLRLDTLEAMTGAIALYRSLGFVEIGNYHGRPLPWALFFEKALR